MGAGQRVVQTNRPVDAFPPVRGERGSRGWGDVRNRGAAAKSPGEVVNHNHDRRMRDARM
jgi:hypothetical protein